MSACAAQPTISTSRTDEPVRIESRLTVAMRRLLDAIQQPGEIDAAWSRTSSAGQFHLLPRRDQDRLLNNGYRH